MPSAKVSREDLLQVLEAISPGTTKRGIIEQSDCFVFQHGRVCSFNGEIYCRARSGLPKTFTGAVHSVGLLNNLRTRTNSIIHVSFSESEMIIEGKRKTSNDQSGIRLEATATLPVDAVEKPTEWKSLKEDFTNGIELVQECAGKNEKELVTVCVRITDKFVEAADGYQMARFNVKTPVSEPFLVRKESIKHIVSLGMTKFAETDNWVHFKNPAGIRLSCNRLLVADNKFAKEMDEAFQEKEGSRTYLPRNLKEAIDVAEQCSKENQDSNYLILKLSENKLQVKGQGVSSWHRAVTRVKYTGKPIQFLIGPKVLGELTKRSTECFIKPGKLRVNGESFTFIATLGAIEK